MYSALDVLLCTASILNICLISLDRYWSITRAVDYLKARTENAVKGMICIVWFLSFVVSLASVRRRRLRRPKRKEGLIHSALTQKKTGEERGRGGKKGLERGFGGVLAWQRRQWVETDDL